jgi:5-methylthioadenosine/S-adenosylhomocysteine deaminase
VIRQLLSIALLAAASLPAEAAPKAKCDLIVTAASVVTVDPSFRVVPDGAVAVRNGEIVAVGTRAEVTSKWTAAATIARPGSALMPGLVNTHTHAAMSLLRGVADDRPLMEWLQKAIFPAEGKNVSPKFVTDGTLLAAAEMIRGGTTTFADMYYFEWDVAAAVERSGLRAVLGETWLDFPVASHKDLPESIRVTRAFLEKWKGHPRVTAAVAPHAPYTCSKETLLAAKTLADEFHAPLLIHLSETRDEQRTIREKYGASPAKWLDSIGFLSPNVLAAHGVWMDDEDLKLLADRKVTLSHNPESNMKLGSGVAPVVAARKAGIAVGLGTDGVAGSNNDLDMFDAMDFAGKLAKVHSLDPTVLPAQDLIRMATVEGARALGLGAKVGSLEVGKRADLVAVDLRTSRSVPWYDVSSALVYSVKASAVSLTMVDGKVLWDGKRVRTLDEAALLKSAETWQRTIAAQLGALNEPAKAASTSAVEGKAAR